MAACASQDLPKVDSAKGDLHHPKATVLLRPRRPQLTTNPIEDEEVCHPRPGVGEVVVTEVVVVVEATNCVAVYGSVEIFRSLASTKFRNHTSINTYSYSSGREPPR